jgi:hypothetical protein
MFNSEIQSIFEIVGVNFSALPNSKIPEKEFLFIKNVTEFLLLS